MAATTTTLTAYLPARAASTASTTLVAAPSKKEWRPTINVPIGTVKDGSVMLNESWFRYFRFLGNAKLGGPSFPTLPEVVTRSELSAQISASAAAITAAQDQQNAANAQALEALRQVVATLASTAAVPPVVLVRPEVPPAPPPPVFGGFEGAGGGGGD